jgi:hypothetical protein
VIECSYEAVRVTFARLLPNAMPEIERNESEGWCPLPGEDWWTDKLIDLILWPYLEDAARRRDVPALRCGADLVEVLMRGGDSDVQNLVVIGVVNPLARTPVLRRAFSNFGLDELVAVGDRYNAVAREGRSRWSRARGRT